MQIKMKKISGDASFREFYRIQKNSGSSILVKANKDKYKNLIVYAAINQFLLKNNKTIDRKTKMDVDVPFNGKVYIGLRQN